MQDHFNERKPEIMKVILAKRAGFCFGVKRATQMAFEAADQIGRQERIDAGLGLLGDECERVCFVHQTKLAFWVALGGWIKEDAAFE